MTYKNMYFMNQLIYIKYTLSMPPVCFWYAPGMPPVCPWWMSSVCSRYAPGMPQVCPKYHFASIFHVLTYQFDIIKWLFSDFTQSMYHTGRRRYNLLFIRNCSWLWILGSKIEDFPSLVQYTAIPRDTPSTLPRKHSITRISITRG